MDSPAVEVVIPTLAWSGRLEACVASLVASGLAPDSITIVFDGDESVNRERGGVSHQVSTGRRLGYGGACNAGFVNVRHRRGDDEFVVAFLNDDVEMPSDWQLAAQALGDEVGLVGFRTHGPHGERTRCRGRQRGLLFIHDGPTLDGCAFMIPATLFESLGGFDESYRMYGEETDLFARAQRRGLLIAECTQLVWHAEEASTSSMPVSRAWLGMRNPVRFALLNRGLLAGLRSIASLLVHAATPGFVDMGSEPYIRRKRSLPWAIRTPLALAAVVAAVASTPHLKVARARRGGGGHLADHL